MVSYERVSVIVLSKYSPTGPWDVAELREHPTYEARTNTILVTQTHAFKVRLRKFSAEAPPAFATAAKAMQRFGDAARKTQESLRRAGYYVR